MGLGPLFRQRREVPADALGEGLDRIARRQPVEVRGEQGEHEVVPQPA
jgi:hypothetical protein